MSTDQIYDPFTIFKKFSAIKEEKCIHPYYVDAFKTANQRIQARLAKLPNEHTDYVSFRKEKVAIKKKLLSKPFLLTPNGPYLKSDEWEIYDYFLEYSFNYCSNGQRIQKLEGKIQELMPKILNECRKFEAAKFEEQVFRLFFFCLVKYGHEYLFPEIFSSEKINELVVAIELASLSAPGLRYGQTSKKVSGKPGRPKTDVAENNRLIAFYNDKKIKNPHLSKSQIAGFYAKMYQRNPKTIQNRLTKLIK